MLISLAKRNIHRGPVRFKILPGGTSTGRGATQGVEVRSIAPMLFAAVEYLD